MTRSAHLLLLFLAGASGLLHAQIIVPDRLPNGERMPAVTTPAERGILPYDTLRTLPAAEGGRESWWHRHAVFSDGPVRLALDPVMDIATERRRTRSASESDPSAPWTSASGFRNVRGVRYAGNIDNRIDFGGKVLEMQRLLVAPETEYVLQAGTYPGMGTGKLRPAEEGLYTLDHSLAEVWFDARISERLRLQWGLGSLGMGPGSRNLLWEPGRAPAPYLLTEVNLGKGWTYRWVQSRRRGNERLPANGAREGRYRPMGLGIRSLTKTIIKNDNTLELSMMVARWSDVLDRGQLRSGFTDWLQATAPWVLPQFNGEATPWYLSGHQGLDIQWRRPQSTWYGQWRQSPQHDPRYESAEGLAPQLMLGHVRHGRRSTFWTEWIPVSNSPAPPHPGQPGSQLGIASWSTLAPWFTQGMECHIAGFTVSSEIGITFPDSLRNLGTSKPMEARGTSFKTLLTFPTASMDPARIKTRHRHLPNRWWPALVPCAPFISFMVYHHNGIQTQWWSMGITSFLLGSRKSF